MTTYLKHDCNLKKANIITNQLGKPRLPILIVVSQFTCQSATHALVFKSQPCKHSLSDCFKLDDGLSSIVWNVFLLLTLDTLWNVMYVFQNVFSYRVLLWVQTRRQLTHQDKLKWFFTSKGKKDFSDDINISTFWTKRGDGLIERKEPASHRDHGHS